jgi:hypothetical protein
LTGAVVLAFLRLAICSPWTAFRSLSDRFVRLWQDLDPFHEPVANDDAVARHALALAVSAARLRTMICHPPEFRRQAACEQRGSSMSRVVSPVHGSPKGMHYHKVQTVDFPVNTNGECTSCATIAKVLENGRQKGFVKVSWIYVVDYYYERQARLASGIGGR